MILLILFGALVVAAVTLGRPLDRWPRRLATLPPLGVVVLAGASVQVTHLLEHVLQFGYWVRQPTDPPWLTPWARSSAAALSDDPVGVEALHLLGNACFLAAAVALVVLIRGHPTRARLAMRGAVVQSVHVLEHVALTVSVAVGGEPIGVTTAFGAVDPGPLAWSLRIAGHFMVNVVATVLVLRAIGGLAADESGPLAPRAPRIGLPR